MASGDSGGQRQLNEQRENQHGDIISQEQSRNGRGSRTTSALADAVEEEKESRDRQPSQPPSEQFTSDDDESGYIYDLLSSTGSSQDRPEDFSASSPMPTPSSHAYLGQICSGMTRPREDLEVGSTLEMPILSLPGVVLFPGESLPLRLSDQAYAELAESMLRGTKSEGQRGARDTVDAGISQSTAVPHTTRGAGGNSPAHSTVEGHLGVVNVVIPTRGGEIKTSLVGTTTEIRSRHRSDEADPAAAGLVVMAKGRHRFRFLEDLGWRRGVLFWRVVISPDVCPAPLRALPPRTRRNCNGSRFLWAISVPRFAAMPNSPASLVARASSLLRKAAGPGRETDLITEEGRRARDLGSAYVDTTHQPQTRSEILSRVANGTLRRTRSRTSHNNVAASRAQAHRAKPIKETHEVVSEIEVTRSNPIDGSDGEPRWQESRLVPGTQSSEDESADEEKGGEEGMVPEFKGKPDPTFFSFQLAANLPLDDDGRQELLELDSVVVRLRIEVQHLEASQRKNLCCGQCGMCVALGKDVFSVPGAEGQVGAYVNPDGYVHQTVTVRGVQNIHVLGRSAVEHSWFPGYAWTPAYCSRCMHHLGWRFTIPGWSNGSMFMEMLALRVPAPGLRYPHSGSGGNRGSIDGREFREGGGVTAPAAQTLVPGEFYGLRRTSLRYTDGT